MKNLFLFLIIHQR